MGLLGERTLDRLDPRAVHEVACICALGAVDAHAETAHLAVGALEVDPHGALVTPVVGQQRGPARRHIADLADPARQRLAAADQFLQQPCRPAPLSGRAIGADRRGHHRCGAAVRAGPSCGQRPRSGHHHDARRTDRTKQDLRRRRPHLGLVKLDALGRDVGSVVQELLLQRRVLRRGSRRTPLAASFTGPGALRGDAPAPAAAVWAWHQTSLPSLRFESRQTLDAARPGPRAGSSRCSPRRSGTPSGPRLRQRPVCSCTKTAPRVPRESPASAPPTSGSGRRGGLHT